MRRLLILIAFAHIVSYAEEGLPPDTRAQIDKAVMDVLGQSGSPSASIAIVKGNKIAYAQAYKDARLEPRAPATPDMIYHIGSVSKQFTAAAILMLAEQSKLSLDDPVSRFLPDLTRASEVKIRQLLSHTSGYQDFWPQDYVFSMMKKPTSAQHILDVWGKKPLDFEPGTQWQYSNTGYVIAGVIVEKASGMAFFEFVKKNILQPLHMKTAFDLMSGAKLPELPTPYFRNALGPLRPAPREGTNWMFAAGELGMTASDLALWNISMLKRELLRPESYAEMQRTVVLKNGLAANYGLGLSIAKSNDRRVLRHSGEVSGFTAENQIFPDDQVAISVLVNQDAVTTSGDIAKKIAAVIFAEGGKEKAEAAAKIFFESLRQGKLDRARLTPNCNEYFNKQALEDYVSSLAPLGPIKELVQTSSQQRGGMEAKTFKVTLASKTLSIWQYVMPDGKIEQFMVLPSE